MANEEYKVAGYGERADYDAPYHPSADLNPAVKFANAGDPEAAAEVAQAEYANEVADEFTEDSDEAASETSAGEPVTYAPIDK